MAKRNEEYSVLKPTHQLTIGFDDVKGRSMELGGDGHPKDDKGHDAQANHVPVPDPVRLEVTMSWVESDPVTSTIVTIVMPNAAS